MAATTYKALRYCETMCILHSLYSLLIEIKGFEDVLASFSVAYLLLGDVGVPQPPSIGHSLPYGLMKASSIGVRWKIRQLLFSLTSWNNHFAYRQIYAAICLIHVCASINLSVQVLDVHKSQNVCMVRFFIRWPIMFSHSWLPACFNCLHSLSG